MGHCKACSASVIVPLKDIEKAVKQLENSRVELATEAVYLRRIEACLQCDFLEYGTTCLKCGCIMQIRARVKNTTCPFSKTPKW